MRYVPFVIALILSFLMLPVRFSVPGLVLFAIPFTGAVVLGYLAFRKRPAEGSGSPQETQKDAL